MIERDEEKVFIIDDLLKYRHMVKDNLSRYGFNNIKSFSTTERALNEYYNLKPSLVFTDINFNPRIDDFRGIDLCNELKSKGSDDLTVVVMSSLREGRRLAMNAGADFFIRKRKFTFDFSKFITGYLNVLRTPKP